MKGHINFSKRYVLASIEKDGAQFVLDDWEGTDQEAMDAIRESKIEWYPINCDNRGEDGGCQGH